MNKQLIILAYYFEVGDRSKEQVQDLMQDVSHIVKNIKENIHNNMGDQYNVEFYAIPTKDYTGLDCVYPKTAEDKQHEQEAIKQLKDIKQQLKEYNL